MAFCTTVVRYGTCLSGLAAFRTNDKWSGTPSAVAVAFRTTGTGMFGRCNQPRQRTYCSYTCGVGSPVSVVSTLTGHAGGSASPDSTQAA